MKRLNLVTMLAVVAMLLMVMAVPALAEDVVGGAIAAYTWATLATVAGATAATLLVVQYIKAPLDKVGHIPTRVLVYLIALLILVGAQAFTDGLTLDSLPLLLVNAFVVALAAMGAYQNTFGRGEEADPPN